MNPVADSYQVLRLLYVATRFASDESNKMLYQISEMVGVGFSLQGKMKAPMGR